MTDKPRIGVTRWDDVPQEARDRYNTKEKAGAVVIDIDPAGPAADAGLRAGDVVVKLNDKAIGSARELSKAVKSLKQGELLRVLVRRGDYFRVAHGTARLNRGSRAGFGGGN